MNSLLIVHFENLVGSPYCEHAENPLCQYNLCDEECKTSQRSRPCWSQTMSMRTQNEKSFVADIEITKFTLKIVQTKSCFSRVLRDSTFRFVGPSVDQLVRPSVRPSVGLSVHHTLLFWVFAVYGLTAPAQVIK